jgi:hypothetical protein
VSAARAHGFSLEPALANHRLALGAAVTCTDEYGTCHEYIFFFAVLVYSTLNNSGVGNI